MTIYLGDCMDFMREQKDDTYDIIVTDPPYEMTKLSFDNAGTVQWNKLSREMLRVLKPNGWLFVFGHLGVAYHFMGVWRHKFEYVWIKPTPAMASYNAVRPWYKHEAINAFINPGVKNMNDLYFDPKSIQNEGSRSRKKSGTIRGNTKYSNECEHSKIKNPYDTFMHHPTTLLYAPNKNTMNADEYTDHPTQKPVSIYETLLLGYCPPRGLALDPFGGSGTLAIAAMNTGREYDIAELNAEYHGIIKDRVSKHLPRMETARKQKSIVSFTGE